MSEEEQLRRMLDTKNVIIGRLKDDVMRLTRAIENREETIKELRQLLVETARPTP
jgi:hypothetical protein